MPTPPDAGAVIIGNEILSGKFADDNAGFLIQRFRLLGVRLREVVFVEDTRAAIAEAVSRLSARYTYVCTTGGIGPTHDDVTTDGVADAFGLTVSEHPELLARMTTHADGAPSAGHKRMTRVPAGSELVWGKAMPWPTVCCRNVYIFPGVPWLLRSKFKDLEHRFASSATEISADSIDLDVEEQAICEALDALVSRHPHVEIGSYPRFEEARWWIRLFAESRGPRGAERVEAALADVRRTFPDVLK